MNIPYINQSLLNMAAKCMKQVEFRYGLGIVIPPAAAAHRGTAVHKAAQTDAEMIRGGKDRLTPQELQDAAETAFRESIERGVYFSEEEAPQKNFVLGNALDEATKAATLYGNEVSPRIGRPVIIEQEHTLTVDGLSLPLGGRIDLVHAEGYDNRHEIIDLKTTGKQPDLAVSQYSIQAPLYSMLAENMLGTTPHFTYDYLVIQKTKETHQMIEAEVTAQSRENVIDRARVLERYLQAGVFMAAAPDSWWCSEKWCGYWGVCPHGQRRSTQISISNPD